MFDHHHYVPVLRWRRAEMKALSELDRLVKSDLTPLVELFPKRFEPQLRVLNGKKIRIARRVSNVITTIVSEIGQFWGKAPFFLDFCHCNPNMKADGKHSLALFAELSKSIGIVPIPVVGLFRSQQDIVACKYVIERLSSGACVRVLSSDIEHQDFETQIDKMVKYLNLPVNKIDIIVDNKIISGNSLRLQTVYNKLSPINSWRTFILLGGAFPIDLTKYQVGTHLIDRNDYNFWLHQKDEIKSNRVPTFGDYTIQHPFLNDRLPEIPNPSASIRYTSSNHWIVMRGTAIQKAGCEQFPAHAEMLCCHEEYCGANFSSGDDYISRKRMSLNPDKTGSVETWLQAGINHHLTFVVRQLASLFGS